MMSFYWDSDDYPLVMIHIAIEMAIDIMDLPIQNGDVWNMKPYMTKGHGLSGWFVGQYSSTMES